MSPPAFPKAQTILFGIVIAAGLILFLYEVSLVVEWMTS